MAGEDRVLAGGAKYIDFQTDPSRYRHWKLGVEGEERLSGHGVSWCATCDGFFFREQHIAVIGGGDSAIEEATFLSRFGSKVTLVHRRGELRASKIMQERAFADPKIDFAWHSAVEEIHGDDKLTGLTLVDTRTGEKRHLDATGLFIDATLIRGVLLTLTRESMLRECGS